MTSKGANPRQANGHRRRQVRRRVLREEDTCWLCGQPVDKTLPPLLDGSPEVDEVTPVALGGSPIDRANCRLSHRLCNQKRGVQTRLALARQRKAAANGLEITTARRWWGDTP